MHNEVIRRTCPRLVRSDAVVVGECPPVGSLVDDSAREHEPAAATDHIPRAVVCEHTYTTQCTQYTAAEATAFDQKTRQSLDCSPHSNGKHRKRESGGGLRTCDDVLAAALRAPLR